MSKYVEIHQNIAFCIILSLLLVLLTQVSYLPIVVSVSFSEIKRKRHTADNEQYDAFKNCGCVVSV